MCVCVRVCVCVCVCVGVGRGKGDGESNTRNFTSLTLPNFKGMPIYSVLFLGGIFNSEPLPLGMWRGKGAVGQEPYKSPILPGYKGLSESS